MTRGFRRTRDGRVAARLSAHEVTLVREVVAEMLELLGEEERGGDEFARTLGIGESRTRPEDPVLARLFPDAYPADEEAAGEFRRYTESDLREEKREAAGTVLSSMPGAGGVHLVLDAGQANAWLRALNDVRLALGTRLGVGEDAHQEFAGMGQNDPRYAGYATYDWLSFLLETLVRALS
ncbi:MAG: DUF2017 domain-containing protein [Streptosporangiaceae bacterium]